MDYVDEGRFNKLIEATEQIEAKLYSTGGQMTLGNFKVKVFKT